MERPRVPSWRKTSASRVGLPRESRTWRAMTLVIVVQLIKQLGRNGEIDLVRLDFFNDDVPRPALIGRELNALADRMI